MVQKRSETEGDGVKLLKKKLKMHEMQETRGNGTKSHTGKR